MFNPYSCLALLIALSLGVAVITVRWSRNREARQSAALSRFASQVSSGALGETIDPDALSPSLRQVARSIEDMRKTSLEQHQSLGRQTATLFEVVGGLREGVIIIDAGRRISFVNQRAAQLFALGDDWLGKAFFEKLRYSALLDGINGALRGEQSQHSIVVRRGAESKTVDCRIFPLERSPEAAAVALFDDVTRVEKLEAIRRNFISDFLHEVRTPLTGIRSSVEFLEAGSSSAEEEQQLRKITLRQLTRLEQLVQDLTELNVIETGDIRLNREETDLRALVVDVVEDLRELISSSGVTTDVSGHSVTASVDPIRVHQIFTNLIENAVRHSGSDRITIDVARDGSEAVIRVSDFGVGMPPGEQEKIFHRFYRIDKSRSQRVPGSGLGLAIVKHLVLQHGGSIGVESAEGKGSTFEVRFPASEGHR